MILKTLSMGKQPVYYVQKSYRNENGKPSTKYVESLGTLEDLEKRFGGEDPIGEAKKYVAELTAQEKENRPNPIVQMGLFTDMDGIPLAFCINPGNTAETTTLKPLEEKLKEKFGLSKVVVCTDGGLSSYDNRKHDSVGERSFITVQSLKKLEGHLQDWATQTTEWKLVDFSAKNDPMLSKEEYDLTQLNPDEYADRLFCRERWIKTKLSKTGEELEQRLIVTFSFKYRDYLRHIRGKQIARAEQSIKNGTAGKLGKNQNDPKRFIKCEKCTVDGEVAQYSSYSLNQEMTDQESRFDGFYGICTDLWDDAPEIIKVNGGRWIIEDCFRLTKTEFEARPVFLQRDDRITAHFLTCFLALIIYKYLEKKVNRAGEKDTSRPTQGPTALITCTVQPASEPTPR